MRGLRRVLPRACCYHVPVDQDSLSVTDDDFDEEDAAEPVQQVSSYIAVIRIIAVLGMGLCVSFGLFISLVGLKGVLIGIPCMLLAIPCYYGMQFAERLASREEGKRVAKESA
jgi:hypothetical protein